MFFFNFNFKIFLHNKNHKSIIYLKSLMNMCNISKNVTDNLLENLHGIKRAFSWHTFLIQNTVMKTTFSVSFLHECLSL